MKKLFLVIILFTLTLNAQEEYGTYTVGGEEISSSINPENGKIYIDIEADGSYGLILTQKQRNSFKLFLEESRIKFKTYSRCSIGRWSNCYASATMIEADYILKDIKVYLTLLRLSLSYLGVGNLAHQYLSTMIWIQEHATVTLHLISGN